MSAAVVDNSYTHGRPIRPLPKRRLRSRLSEDANATLFTPPQQPSTPLFYFPYNNYAGDQALGGTGQSTGFTSGNHGGDHLQDSSDEEENSNGSISRGVGNGAPGATEGAVGQLDSYEWSENTNNKKKRKIPTPANPGCANGNGIGGSGGGGGGGGSHTSPGFSPTSTSAPRSRWKPSSSSQRSPLSVISSGSHGVLRRPGRRYPSSPSTEAFTRRLANGKAGDTPPTTSSKESRRELSDSADLPAPKQTQFTFVCESPVSANLAFIPPVQHVPNSNSGGATADNSYQKSMQTVGTQTSPSISNTNAAYPPTPQTMKKKSNPSRTAASRKEYALQQQRRRRQEAGGGGNNNGEIWICEFCEYESIFGEPPEALMRQYDIKDRKERKRLAEKRRLLEKAKQKGKKNSGRNNKKSTMANQNSSNAVSAPPPPPSTADSQGTQSDNTPLASATATPALKPQRHSQQVQTDAFLEGNSHVSAGRGAGGGGGGGGGGGSKNGIAAGGGSEAPSAAVSL